MVARLEMGYSCGLMGQGMLANSCIIKLMDKDSVSGPMAGITLGLGRTIEFMGRAPTLGQTPKNMLAVYYYF